MKAIHFPRRRALVAALAASALMLAACGGGSGNSTPADYNNHDPGTVTLTVTHKVTLTVTMPDLTGVTGTLDAAGYAALPQVTKTIRLGLDHTHAPLSTDNFLAYVKSGAFANTIFHRVIAGFVVQGGGYTRAGDGTLTHIATTGTIALESRNGLSNTRGTLAMARTDEANSATSEFFVNLVDNSKRLTVKDGAIVTVPYLDWGSTESPGYAVFGTVLDAASLAVIDQIATIATDTSDQPLGPVTVTAVAIN